MSISSGVVLNKVHEEKASTKKSPLSPVSRFGAETSLRRIHEWFFWSGFGLVWLQFFVSLLPTWTLPQSYYEYGWFIPPAFAFFLWRRFREISPTPRISKSHERFFWILIGAVAIPSLTVLRVIESIDGFWRLPLILHGLLIFTVSLLALHLRYGFKHTRHLAPALLFGFFALPLPSVIESRLVQLLTDWVVVASSEIILWLGTPVKIVGDHLVSTNGRVEVGEGCSGLRSFQSLIFAGLFFGELLRFRFGGRLLLVLLGVFFGITTNTIRAVTLAQIRFRGGEELHAEWHDTVGQVAFFLAAALFYFTSRWLENRLPESPLRQVTTSPLPNQPYPRAIPGWILGFFSIAIIAEASRLTWTGFRPTHAVSEPIPFCVVRPTAHQTELDLSTNDASQALGFNEGEWKVIRDPTENRVIEFFHLLYQPNNSHLFMDLFSHDPVVCMSSSGYAFRRAHPDRLISSSNREVPFQALEFEHPSGAPHFIFKLRWIATVGALGPTRASSAERLTFARRFSQTGAPAAVIVMAGVTGAATESEAWDFFQASIECDFLIP
ncbi:MAG: exosortase/archaeosortase family protein [Verrucomicrobiota bacterium]